MTPLRSPSRQPPHAQEPVSDRHRGMFHVKHRPTWTRIVHRTTLQDAPRDDHHRPRMFHVKHRRRRGHSRRDSSNPAGARTGNLDPRRRREPHPPHRPPRERPRHRPSSECPQWPALRRWSPRISDVHVTTSTGSRWAGSAGRVPILRAPWWASPHLRRPARGRGRRADEPPPLAARPASPESGRRVHARVPPAWTSACHPRPAAHRATIPQGPSRARWGPRDPPPTHVRWIQIPRSSPKPPGRRPPVPGWSATQAPTETASCLLPLHPPSMVPGVSPVESCVRTSEPVHSATPHRRTRTGPPMFHVKHCRRHPSHDPLPSDAPGRTPPRPGSRTVPGPCGGDRGGGGLRDTRHASRDRACSLSRLRRRPAGGSAPAPPCGRPARPSHADHR